MIIDISFDPIVAQFGSFQLNWSGLFATSGMVLALWLAWHAVRSRGISDESLGRIATWALVGAVIGGRLVGLLSHLSYYRATPGDIVAFGDGSIAPLGCWIGGVVGCILAAQECNAPIWTVLDAATPGVLVGQLSGWLGALANGAAWGLPTDGTWGIVYWNPHDVLPPALLGIPTQPYPLYQAGGILLLLAGIRLGERWLAPREGLQFCVAAGFLVAMQYGLAYLRPRSIVFGGLGVTQAIAIIAAAALTIAIYGYISGWSREIVAKASRQCLSWRRTRVVGRKSESASRVFHSD